MRELFFSPMTNFIAGIPLSEKINVSASKISNLETFSGIIFLKFFNYAQLFK